MRKSVKEFVGPEIAQRLQVEFGEKLVDSISVNEFDIGGIGRKGFDLELTISCSSIMSRFGPALETDAAIAKIRRVLYKLLERGEMSTSISHICTDSSLPTDIILMHPKVYAELASRDRELLTTISNILKRKKN